LVGLFHYDDYLKIKNEELKMNCLPLATYF